MPTSKKKTTGLAGLVSDLSPAPEPPIQLKETHPEVVTQITEAIHGQPKRLGRPPKGQQTTKFTTNIDSALLKQVKRYCVEAEITVRDFLEQLIQERLKRPPDTTD